jgi:alpha-L-rhamnosidase
MYLECLAGWSDAVTVVPDALRTAYGDTGVLERMLDSMKAWVDYVAGQAGPGRLWNTGIQLGDWLDPTAPPEAPMMGRTDSQLCASAYFARSAQIVSEAAGVLGRHDVRDQYAQLAAEIRAAFRSEYLTHNCRLMSDSVTAYALAVAFDLIDDPEERAKVAAGLSRSVAEWRFQIATGFLGTGIVLPALTSTGDTRSAYRLITQTRRPSWLYSVLLGATTVWERWDALLPDGSVNPGEMTSFNHYAFGAVAEWMHATIGGLAPAEPGYRRIRVAPVPGPGVTAASATLRTPYGPAACRWSLAGRAVELEVEVPPNASASVVRPGVAGDVEAPIEVAAGRHTWSYEVSDEQCSRWADADWNPGP